MLGMGYERPPRAPRAAAVSSAEGDASANGAKGVNGADKVICARAQPQGGARGLWRARAANRPTGRSPASFSLRCCNS